MADSVKTIEYQLQGDTTGFERALSVVSSTLDSVEKTLRSLSTDNVKIIPEDQVIITDAVAGSLERVQSVTATYTTTAEAAYQQLTSNTTALNNMATTCDITSTSTAALSTATADASKSFKYGKRMVKEFAEEAEHSTSVFKTLAAQFTKFFSLYRIIRWLIQGYEEAAKFVETLNLFNVATKTAETNLKAFAQSMADTYHMDIGQIMNSISIFRQYGNTMGFAAMQADVLGENMTKLANDLASLYNVTSEEMANVLKSGLAGQTKSLMRYGISVHKATIEQFMLNKGIEKSWNDLNETEKVMLRYAAILDQTTSAQGDLAKTLESPANQMKIFKDQLLILLRNLGSFVVIVGKLVVPVLNGLLVGLNAALSALARAAGYEFPDYSDNLSANALATDDAADSLDNYEQAMKGLLAPMDEINQATSSGDDKLLGEVDPAILDLMKGYDNLMDRVTTKTDVFAKIFGLVFDEKRFEAIGNVIGSVFNILGQGITIATNLLTTFAPVLNALNAPLTFILNTVSFILDKIVSPILKFVETLTSNIWLLIAAFVALNLIQLAYTGSAKGMIAVKAIQWFAQLTGKIIANTAALLANIAATLKQKIASIAMAAVLWWETSAWWQKAIAIIAAAGAMALVVAGIVMAATSSAKSTASQTTNQDFTPSNSAPALATGGVVSSPTYALIGEGQYNEAVVPLGNSPQFATMKEDIADMVARKISPTPTLPSPQLSAGYTQGTPVILQLDGREFARAIIPSLGIAQPQTGVKIQR